jgi:predicted amidohydrolase YtcJ
LVSEAADLLIVGGRLFIPDAQTDEAPDAIAIRAGQIAWIGRREDALRDWRGPRTQVVEAHGRLVTPGFDDAHIHVREGANELDRVDLFRLASVAAVQETIAAHAAADHAVPWVLGRGWLYMAFPGGMPDRGQLDAVVPDRPAFMGCFDGHTGWANTAALRLAGIDRETADPPDGEIVRDPSTGEATGVLKEGAQQLVTRHIPHSTTASTLDALRRTITALHAAGITAIQEAWAEPEDVPLWRTLRDDGALRVRARLALPMRPGGTLEEWRATLDAHEALVGDLRGGEWLDAGILKAFADGVIEARTAAMLDPYVDDASTGRPEWDPEALDAFVAEADRRGWQVEIHAIGDAGIRMALDAFERAAMANPGRDPDRRHRVEHIEAIAATDIPRFARLGVIASMQPYHADPSPNQVDVWAANIGPDRAGRAWSWGSIRRAGGVLAFGSDWPVVPFDPIIALNSAVNRQTGDGLPGDGWLPSERLSIPDALTAYGHGSAYAAFADGGRGSLRVDADADLVVLDRDILAEGPSSIIGTTVALTVVAGQVVHRSEALS